MPRMKQSASLSEKLAQFKSGLNDSENVSSENIREFKFPGGEIVLGKHVIIQPADFENIIIHPNNPRSKESHTKESLSDILPSIEENGITMDGIACLHNGKIALLDCSRRFASAKFTNQPLPLWVMEKPLTIPQCKYIIEIAKLHKSLTYREQGQEILAELENALKNARQHSTPAEAICEYWGEDINDSSSMKTFFRKIDAALLHEKLIELFPDFVHLNLENYNKLITLQRNSLLTISPTKVKYRDRSLTPSYNEELISDLANKISEIKLSSNDYKNLVSNKEKHDFIIENMQNILSYDSNFENESTKNRWSAKTILSKSLEGKITKQIKNGLARYECEELSEERQKKLEHLLTNPTLLDNIQI